MTALFDVKDDDVSIAVATGMVNLLKMVVERAERRNLTSDEKLRIVGHIGNKMGADRLIRIIDAESIEVDSEYAEIIYKEIDKYIENRQEIPTVQQIKSRWNLPIKMNI